jgi:hypothetical protein
MNAKKTVGTLSAGALLVAAFPVFADPPHFARDHGFRDRGHDRGHAVVVVQHYRRPVVRPYVQAVYVARPVYVDRPVYVAPPVYVQRPVIYSAPAAYYQPAAYYPPAAPVNVLGTLAGATLGAVVGHQIGHGDGKTAATIVGGVVGGVIGSRSGW